MNRRDFLGFTPAMLAAAAGAMVAFEAERQVPRIFVSVDDRQDSRRYVGKVRVYLDGVEVSRRAAYAWMPEHPGVEAQGAVGLIPESPTRYNIDPATTHGLVRWEWIEGNG